MKLKDVKEKKSGVIKIYIDIYIERKKLFCHFLVEQDTRCIGTNCTNIDGILKLIYFMNKIIKILNKVACWLLLLQLLLKLAFKKMRLMS